MAVSTRHHPFHNTLQRVWDVGTLDWLPMTQPGGGTGGGGDASAANQVTGNASLAAIKTDVDRIPAQGQAVAANSLPVVLTAAQVATLTPLSTVAVTGTFWQVTQPVSIASMPSTPVTGTFWQVTQPVSLATAPTTPVTGTFWQTTQPVSGPLTDTQLRATAVPVTLTSTTVTGSVAVTSAGLTNLDVALSTRLKPADTLAGVTTVAAVTAITNALPTGTNTLGSVKVTDGTTTVKVTVANAQPASTDGALLVNAIDTFAGTALASASRGVATINVDIVNYNGKGIRVWQDLTVLGASSVCTFTIQEKDPVSGKFITLLASAATGAGINGTGTAKLTVYPGLTAAANSIASDVVPMNIRIVSTVTTAASTFSIGYSLIP